MGKTCYNLETGNYIEDYPNGLGLIIKREYAPC